MARSKANTHNSTKHAGQEDVTTDSYFSFLFNKCVIFVFAGLCARVQTTLYKYVMPFWSLNCFVFCLNFSKRSLGLGRYSHYRYTIDTDVNRYVSIRSSCCIDTDNGDSRINNDFSGTKTIRSTLDFHTIRQKT